MKFRLKIFIVYVGYVFLISGCVKDSVSDRNESENGTLVEISPGCKLTYNDNRLVSFQSRPLTYSTDTTFIYYDNAGKMKKAVRQLYVNPDYYYTLAFFKINNGQISQITRVIYRIGAKLNPETLDVNRYGFDTTGCLSERYFFEYDPQGRVAIVRYNNVPLICGAFSRTDSLKYPNNTSRNISSVISKRDAGGVDSVVFSQYENNSNPVYKYVPELFYASTAVNDGSFNYMCQPYKFPDSKLTTYLALCPNSIKKLRFLYSFVYSTSLDEYTLTNTADSRGNTKMLTGWLDLISYGTGYSYSYD